MGYDNNPYIFLVRLLRQAFFHQARTSPSLSKASISSPTDLGARGSRFFWKPRSFHTAPKKGSGFFFTSKIGLEMYGNGILQSIWSLLFFASFPEKAKIFLSEIGSTKSSAAPLNHGHGLPSTRFFAYETLLGKPTTFRVHPQIGKHIFNFQIYVLCSGPAAGQVPRSESIGNNLIDKDHPTTCQPKSSNVVKGSKTEVLTHLKSKGNMTKRPLKGKSPPHKPAALQGTVQSLP